MTEPNLKRLVDALDTAADWAADTQQPWQDDLDLATLRLNCLRKRLGDSVKASPYLAFLQRIRNDSAGAQASVATGA